MFFSPDSRPVCIHQIHSATCWMTQGPPWSSGLKLLWFRLFPGHVGSVPCILQRVHQWFYGCSFEPVNLVLTSKKATRTILALDDFGCVDILSYSQELQQPSWSTQNVELNNLRKRKLMFNILSHIIHSYIIHQLPLVGQSAGIIKTIEITPVILLECVDKRTTWEIPTDQHDSQNLMAICWTCTKRSWTSQRNIDVFHDVIMPSFQ